MRLKIGEGIAGWVAKHGEPLLVPDVYTDPRFAKRIDEMTQWKTHSIMCIPLLSKHRVLGVMQLINVEMHGFGDTENGAAASRWRIMRPSRSIMRAGG